MELYLINNKGSTNITNIATEVTLTGEYRSCCRELEFGITDNVNISLGDTIRLVESNRTMFYGIVWSKNRDSDNKVINFNAKDYGIYLKKNTHTYKFRNITADNIVRRVCSDFKIPVGNLSGPGIRINRNFINENLYDIIMTAYTLGCNGKKFFAIFEENKFNVLEKGQLVYKHIKQQSNLINSSVSESLDNVVNRVDIYNHEDKIIKSIRNDNSIKLYGILNDYIKLSKDDKTDYNKKAKEKLKNVEKKITVTNFGDVTYKTGYGVVVQEPITGLYCTFFIDEDTHIWRNGLYTNKLVLNLQNVMDKKEDGSLEENKTLKKSSGKKNSKKKGKKKKGNEDYSVYTNRLKK